MTVNTYVGSDFQLEELLRRFGDTSNVNDVIPVGIIAVTAKAPKESYSTLLKNLKKTAEERAKNLGICGRETAYLPNIRKIDEWTLIGDLFEPRCYSSNRRPVQQVRTYSKSGEELSEILQRELTPLEHFAVDIEKSTTYDEALGKLVKSAKPQVGAGPDKTYYVADINFDPVECVITGQLYESGLLSTCENIIS